MKRFSLLSLEEATRLLGVPPVTVQRWAHQGKSPANSKATVLDHYRCELKAHTETK